MATDPMTGSTIVEYPDVESENSAKMVMAEFAIYLAEQETTVSAAAISVQELIHRAVYWLSGEVVSTLDIDKESTLEILAEVEAAYSVDSLMPDVGELGSEYEKVDTMHAIVENALVYIAANPDQFDYADDET